MHLTYNLFLALYLGHLLTDFVFQTDRLVSEKQGAVLECSNLRPFLQLAVGLCEECFVAADPFRKRASCRPIIAGDGRHFVDHGLL